MMYWLKPGSALLILLIVGTALCAATTRPIHTGEIKSENRVAGCFSLITHDGKSYIVTTLKNGNVAVTTKADQVGSLRDDQAVYVSITSSSGETTNEAFKVKDGLLTIVMNTAQFGIFKADGSIRAMNLKIRFKSIEPLYKASAACSST